MFNSITSPYTVRKPIKSKDDYNQDIVTYEEVGTIQAFIGLTGYTYGSPQAVIECSHVGTTASTEVELRPGYLVGDYEVRYVVATPANTNTFFYC